MVNNLRELMNEPLTEHSVIDKWQMAINGIYDRFMITWCPMEKLDDIQENLYGHHLLLQSIFKKARTRGIEAEFTCEYGDTNRLHYHIVLMFRSKSALYTFNKTIYHKLRKAGFVKKSDYHGNLPEYLLKERTKVEIKHPSIPTCFSLETLEKL